MRRAPHARVTNVGRSPRNDPARRTPAVCLQLARGLLSSHGIPRQALGRAKETAGDVADKAAPMVEKAQEAAGQAWDKAKDRVGDAKDTAGDAAEDGEGHGLRRRRRTPATPAPARALRPPRARAPSDRRTRPRGPGRWPGRDRPRRGRRSDASSSNSSRRWVRIISGPSVAIVNATPCSTKRWNVSRTSSSSRSAFVRRFEVGQISSVTSASRSSSISSGSRAARIPCPMRSGRSVSTTSRISSAPVSPSSPTWIVTPSPAARAVSTIGATPAVVVARAAGPRAGDVDADDAAARPVHGLLDDDLVLPVVERAVHHQDQAGAHLRVLEAGAVEPADRREDDVVEVALAAAVALHRVEPQLERRDPLRAVGAADRAVDRALDGKR